MNLLVEFCPQVRLPARTDGTSATRSCRVCSFRPTEPPSLTAGASCSPGIGLYAEIKPLRREARPRLRDPTARAEADRREHDGQKCHHRREEREERDDAAGEAEEEPARARDKEEPRGN